MPLLAPSGSLPGRPLDHGKHTEGWRDRQFQLFRLCDRRKIISVTETATGTKIDVRDTPVDVLTENLNSGTWTISLGDFLYENNSDSDIEILEFEPNLQFCG